MKEWPPDKAKGCVLVIGAILTILFVSYVLFQSLSLGR
jgi:hypothetical protein